MKNYCIANLLKSDERGIVLSDSPYYFIAILLPNYIKEFLSKWQLSLRKSFTYRQWVHQEDFHITLKFLGPIQDKDLPFTINYLNIVRHVQSFSLYIGSLGSFGHRNRPRVLWAGVQLMDHLTSLQALIEEQMSSIGFENVHM